LSWLRQFGGDCTEHAIAQIDRRPRIVPLSQAVLQIGQVRRNQVVVHI
jgi:hypothetical protein